MDRQGKIVVVDDDTIVTSSLRTLFRIEGFKDAKYFNDPKEALEFLKEEKPDLIMSDFIMPEMNGLEFLSKAKELYPEVSMILLTGYADKENAIKAINDIGLYKYIEKPWDNDDLIINMKNGIERSYLLSNLREKINELEVAKKELEKYSHNLEDIVSQRTTDLKESNSKLAGIIGYCADGIIIVDEKGKIIQANPACENLTGMDENSLKKFHLKSIVITEKDVNLTEELSNKSEIVLRNCFVKNNIRNKQIPVEISFAGIETETTTPSHYVGVIRNVSVQKEAERLRDDFIATLTHDLRTPLLAAIQTLKFFLDGSLGELTEKQTVLLSTMQRSNEDLLGLVNALLEVYKYDAGKLQLCKTKFSIKELAQQTYEELLPLANHKNIEFKFDYEPKEDLVINADRGEIHRVITNLCGNAINYTKAEGKTELSVKENEDDIIVTVTDTGNGIPAEDIPHLFKRFSQGTSKKRSSGTGLGLYLSRQIIEAHGGKIWLDSVVNKGSEFSFLLTNAVISRKELITK